jgi:hypothetical protein
MDKLPGMEPLVRLPANDGENGKDDQILHGRKECAGSFNRFRRTSSSEHIPEVLRP